MSSSLLDTPLMGLLNELRGAVAIAHGSGLLETDPRRLAHMAARVWEPAPEGRDTHEFARWLLELCEAERALSAGLATDATDGPFRVRNGGATMANVLLHTHPAGGSQWRDEYREFARIPVVGEYLALAVAAPWYQVQLVVHTPFLGECEAEVYAVRSDHLAAIRAAADALPGERQEDPDPVSAEGWGR